MCTPQLLHHSEIGLVRYCSDCRNYQIAFGTTVFTLDDTEFAYFRLNISKISTLDTQCKIKDIWISLPCEDVGLLINTAELTQLKQLCILSMHAQKLNTLLMNSGVCRPT